MNVFQIFELAEQFIFLLIILRLFVTSDTAKGQTLSRCQT